MKVCAGDHVARAPDGARRCRAHERRGQDVEVPTRLLRFRQLSGNAD
jgi:hypothetical protein